MKLPSSISGIAAVSVEQTYRRFSGRVVSPAAAALRAAATVFASGDMNRLSG